MPGKPLQGLHPLLRQAHLVGTIGTWSRGDLPRFWLRRLGLGLGLMLWPDSSPWGCPSWALWSVRPTPTAQAEG